MSNIKKTTVIRLAHCRSETNEKKIFAKNIRGRWTLLVIPATYLLFSAVLSVENNTNN